MKVEAHRVIRASVQKVFQLVSRLDTLPRVTGLWLSADVLDRRPGQATVHYTGYFAGIPVESVQRATLQPPSRVEFRQTRGGLRSLQGQYTLQSVDGETDLTVRVEADIGIPLIPNTAAQRVLRSYVERLLDKFKLAAERDLPRVVRRVREETAPAAAEATAAAETPPPEVVVEPEEAPPPAVAAPVAQPALPGERKRRRRRRRRRRQPTQSTQPTQPPQSPAKLNSGS